MFETLTAESAQELSARTYPGEGDEKEEVKSDYCHCRVCWVGFGLVVVERERVGGRDHGFGMGAKKGGWECLLY